MKLKGTTKIELTNVKTGEKETYTHDNFVTEFASEYFKECGALNTNPVGSLQNAYPLDDLFGGILLFDNEIDANSDDTGKHPSPIYVPAGVNMTANASVDFQSNSSATELGQYNSEESTTSNTERTYVFDWGTNEGNGDISCVCLTSKAGGYIGTGNALSEVADITSLVRNLFYYNGENPKDRTITSDAQSRLATMDISKSQVALLSTSAKDCFTNGKVVLKWYDVPARKLNPFANKLAFDDTQLSPSKIYPDITITQRTVSAARVMGGIGYILLVGSSTGNTSSGSTIYAVKISEHYDANNQLVIDVTEKTYSIVSASKSIPLNDTNPIYGCIMPDNALYLGYKSAASWTYNCTHSYIPTSGVTKDLTVAGTSTQANPFFGVINGRIMLGDVSWYDPVLDKTVKTNSKQLEPSAFAFVKMFPVFDGYQLACGQGNKTGQSAPYASPLDIWRPPCVWLSTINNLDTTVTKTADKTMKVTYTLSLSAS